MPPLHVGTVPYLVGRPLDTGLGDEPGIRLTQDVPARLVERLREGELDVALVSSIELFRRPGYRYLADLAVCGRGHVASVQLFLRKPLEHVRRVALDPASRAAATLTRVLLGERPVGPPEFIEVAAGEDPREVESADAWLRIGDAALREFLAPDPPPTFNLCEAWVARMGLPFVFAAWIVRPGVDVNPHLLAFARSRERGARRIGELALEGSRAFGLPVEACWHYLREECHYDPGADMHRALLAFRDAAAVHGLCQQDLEPTPLALPALHVPQAP